MYWIISFLLVASLGGPGGANPRPHDPSAATISGTATDSYGGILPGANITVLNEDTNETRTSVADENGRFVLKNLAPGAYELQVRRSCFATFHRAGIALHPGDVKTIDASLPPCMYGSHLDMKKSNFTKTVVRKAGTARAEALIARAERIPCPSALPGSLLQKGEPSCANAKARDYYFHLLDTIKAKLVSLHNPLSGGNATIVNAYYGAEASFDPKHHQWTVKISIEFVDECGMLCGEGVNRTRAVFFDENGRLLKVIEGDECDCHWLS